LYAESRYNKVLSFAAQSGDSAVSVHAATALSAKLVLTKDTSAWTVATGPGRTAALHCRPSASYQTRGHMRCRSV
jgi:hypothetical protein